MGLFETGRNTSDFEAAAKKLPKNRTVQEQALVDEGKRVGVGNVRNLDHEAQRTERNGG